MNDEIVKTETTEETVTEEQSESPVGAFIIDNRELNKEEDEEEVHDPVDLSQIKVGDYVLMDFHSSTKLKSAEGYVTSIDDGTLNFVRGKVDRVVSIQSIKEIITVDPPAYKKAIEELQDAKSDTGIDRMLGVGIESKTYHMSATRLWVDDGFNPRSKITKVKVKNLAASMRINGYMSEFPIVARRVVRMIDQKPVKGFEIIDGHRRHAAALEVGVDVAVILKDHKDLTDDKRLITALVANDGEKLSMYETAAAIKRLIDVGLTRKEVGERLGKPTAYVTMHMRLLDADPAVVDALKKNEVGATKITQLLRDAPKDHAEQVKLLEGLKKGDEEASRLRTRAKRVKKEAAQKKKEESAKEKADRSKYMTKTKAVAKLVTVADFYSAFKSRGDLVKDDPEWIALEKALVQILRMKRQGLLKLS